MKRKVYDREFKEAAVKMVKEQGLSHSKVARDLGLTQTTISNWVAGILTRNDGRGRSVSYAIKWKLFDPRLK